MKYCIVMISSIRIHFGHLIVKQTIKQKYCKDAEIQKTLKSIKCKFTKTIGSSLEILSALSVPCKDNILPRFLM